MTPEAQRIAIAEASQGTIEFFEGVWYYWSGTSRIACKDSDPLQDLNAMHEAEKVLLSDDATYSQRNFYASLLGSITLNDNGRGWQPLSNDDCFPILHATAAARAEAFLRTLNLWTDEQ
jgi:hypothetical protein